MPDAALASRSVHNRDVLQVHGFPPISDPRVTVLILGSMPSKASLRAGQYYAHPQNAFWRIIEGLFEIAATEPYEKRCARLIARRVAVWDVLKTCTRSSSLDSDIVESSIVTNDFQRFFDSHPRIRGIYFNGATAEKTFMRYVLPELDETIGTIPKVRLPSTSPANASLNVKQKLRAWKAVTQ